MFSCALPYTPDQVPALLKQLSTGEGVMDETRDAADGPIAPSDSNPVHCGDEQPSTLLLCLIQPRSSLIHFNAVDFRHLCTKPFSESATAAAKAMRAIGRDLFAKNAPFRGKWGVVAKRVSKAFAPRSRGGGYAVLMVLVPVSSTK